MQEGDPTPREKLAADIRMTQERLGRSERVRDLRILAAASFWDRKRAIEVTEKNRS